MLLRRLLSSFSFRLMFITLLVVFGALTLMRVALYRSTLNEARSDVETNVNEQLYHIDRGIRGRGFQHGLNLIAAVMHYDIENNYALSYRDRTGRLREGNLSAWPRLRRDNEGWAIFRVTTSGDNAALTEADDKILGDIFRSQQLRDMGVRTFLARTITYPNGAELLVGYDMRHVSQLQRVLVNLVLETTLISLAVALLCGLVIAYWINRRLRTLNRTCAQIMAGDLSVRVPSTGGRDEFDQLAQHFNDMLSWITRLIHSIQDTTNALAHDMRTPLSRHRIALSKLEKAEGLQNKHRQTLSSAIDEVDNIVNLYDALLNISRAESREAVAEFRDFDICESLHNLVELYETIAEEKQILLQLHCPEHLMLHGAQQMVAQAVANLLDNAIKYAPENTQVTLSAHADDRSITITVRDEGAGIPTAERDKVKERFYRCDKSRSTPGTGLGLSLVEAVMRLHGGSFTLHDADPGLLASLQFQRLS